jgi:hypothetical protein
MSESIAAGKRGKTMTTALINLIAIAFVYSVPAISHLLSFPVYLLEPMRIMLVLAIVHTSRRNAYLLAVSLPLFSLLISGHPVIYKAGLIMLELSLNVWLFFMISKFTRNRFVSMLSSIIASKIIYYGLKYLLISAAVLESGLVSTPLYIQAITMTIFSGYVYLMFRDK